MVTPDWEEHAAKAIERHEDGLARLPEGADERQRQLTRTGNAAWAAGLAFLMLGRMNDARTWLRRAADRYRESWPDAPRGSWGRPIGAMKARLLAGDFEGASEDARWALEAGADETESPIGRYAATLAYLVHGEDAKAAPLATSLSGHDDFPASVADSLAAIAARDAVAYETAIGALLSDFEQRDEFLEDVAVADTVLVLQLLAEPRGLVVELESPLLPAAPALS